MDPHPRSKSEAVISIAIEQKGRLNMAAAISTSMDKASYPEPEVLMCNLFIIPNLPPNSPSIGYSDFEAWKG